MERKIGEIFEYNGEWYQCIRSILTCSSCEIPRPCTKIRELGYCSPNMRNDKEQVVFKKLEKVGEPYKALNRLFQAYKVFTAITYVGNYDVAMIPHYKTIDIEIKQNKEDMEEKNLNLKPFDIQKAREGKPVCTRDGRKARIICFDAKGNKPLIILSEIDGKEVILRYTEKGQSDSFHSPTPREDDLMMLPEKKEGWAVIRRSDIYETEEQAKEVLLNSRIGIMIKKIEWEE